jgi:ATP-dependent DNA ligase
MGNKVKASFIQPMLLARTEKLPEGSSWLYELKLDGFKSIAFKSAGKVHLRSRNDKDFNSTYPAIVKALADLPDETVLDEIVAMDKSGRPSVGALQNYGSVKTPILYYVFDVMMLGGVHLIREPLSRRRELLEQSIVPNLVEPIKYSSELDSDLQDLLQSVKTLGLEGLIAKRRDSRYEPGLRSGAWQKMRVNKRQAFVIGGYTIGNPFDALVFGYYEGERLVYVARTRNGFTPASRQRLAEKFRGLVIEDCPFANLPQTTSGRWGQGLTQEKMQECRWLKPVLVGDFRSSSSITEPEKLHIAQCEECRDVLQAARRPFWRRIVLTSELDRNSSDVNVNSQRRLPLLRDTILRCHP